MLYAGEGESRKPDENATPPVMTDSDKVQTIVMKVRISFRVYSIRKTSDFVFVFSDFSGYLFDKN